MSYKYIRPTWYEAKSERDVEVSFLLTELYNLFTKIEAISLLDVGFAGSGYIEKILDFGSISYTGLDGNAARISGNALRIPKKSVLGYSLEKWRQVLTKIKCVEADVIDYVSSFLYDIVISISTIEHIVPAGYDYKNAFDFYRDIQAVDCMKKLTKEKGYLLLTFPCGEECIFSSKKEFKDKMDKSLQSKVIESRRDILIYNKDRIKKVIGCWELIKERYWINYANGFEECEKDAALSLEYTVSDLVVKSLCTLLLKKV